MKTYKYLLLPIILLFLTNCYIYKPYTEKEVEEVVQNPNPSSKAKSIRTTERSSDDVIQKTKEQQGMPQNSIEDIETQTKKENERDQKQKNEQQSNVGFSRSDGSTGNETKRSSNTGKNTNVETSKSKDLGIKGKLQPNKYYKITALGNQYKIQVDKWDGDTLISHKLRQPKKVYKHHMNDIVEEEILERRFSKPFSDLLTVGAYASGAAIVLLLVL